MLYQLKEASPRKIMVSINFEGKEIPMQVDTGAGISIIPIPI